MSVFAIIFAVLILTLFWGGFIYMLLYTLKLKGQQGQPTDDDEGMALMRNPTSPVCDPLSFRTMLNATAAKMPVTGDTPMFVTTPSIG